MFNPSKEDVRRFFCDAWTRHRQGGVLTPLEAIAVDWIGRHPEYQDELSDAAVAVARDYSIDDGRTNPFLHLSMHLPEWHGRVVYVAFAYPSRQDLPVYREYTGEVQRIAAEINAAFATPDWQPVEMHVRDDFARSLAAYRLADVVLVNPIRDGMNLVAKEVPVVSEAGCALVLSREAGAAEDLGDHAVMINPYDVTGTADAHHEALVMPAAERADRAKALAAAATALPPARWFTDQLEALGG